MFASMRTMAVSAAAVAFLSIFAPVQAMTYHGYHIMPTPSYLAKLAKIGRSPAQSSGPMNYYGGSVFKKVKVVSVMWGDSVNSTIVATIPGFSAALPNSTYIDQMAQYGTHLTGINGHEGTNQDIGRGKYLGQFVITPKNQNTTLTDDDVQKELKSQIRKGNLPARDLNTLYMIYFPVTVSINLDGLQSCVDFGAYHFATVDTKLAKRNIFYTVEPDCHSSINSITFAASHEFAEATTDNVPTPGSFPDFPQAWNDSNGFEIGDLCGNSGQLTAGSSHWTVTQYMLNSTGHCSTGNYTSP
jgi:hypothetical protein